MGAISPQREAASRARGALAHQGPGRRAVARATLPGGPLAPGAARRFVRATLAEWTDNALPGTELLTDRLADDATVVVSELVTNAVVHAGTDVDLQCRLDRADTGPAGPAEEPQAGDAADLVLEVSDHHPRRVIRDDGSERPYGTPEYGRGLRLVAALSAEWGISYRTGAKTVWSRLRAGGPAAVEEQIEAYGGEQAPEHGVRVADLLAPEPGRGARPQDHDWVSRGALTFLAEASDLLAGQLDEDLVAALAGQLLVPRIADWCAVWLEDEVTAWRGSDRPPGAPGPRLARVWHVSENRIEELRRALEKDPPRLSDTVRSRAVPVPWPGGGTPDGTAAGGVPGGTAAGVVPSGTAAGGMPGGTAAGAIPGGTGAAPGVGGGADAGGVPGGADAGGAALAYRLLAGGRPMGTIVIGRAGSAGFPDEVTGLVEDLSRRVALAIGAARQYARQATISRVLQRGLLPGAVAEIPGVRSALVYEPCDKGGPSGDFYDLFPAGDGRWCFAVGDVQGKGPEAAVVIGLARPWLRLLAREGYQVAEVLDRLNQLLLDDATEAADAAARALVATGGPGLLEPEGPQTRFLSMLYGELVPVEGGVRCTLVSAGHPLPLVLEPDGSVREVAAPQTLLGVIEDARYTAETFELHAGDTLLCVTDGVTERRNGSRQFDDDDGLATALSGCTGLNAQLVAERIRRLVHEFGPNAPEDDLALLVLQAE
ncbi:SpoIIE family protein phosphatase [Streptomyces sp. NPDC059786]|uniref:SpoIIE family protein phosphatase n=1 Tax=Streptomyces sp. NPDC059786 TaxID=3346946 RepID=UPI003662ED81